MSCTIKVSVASPMIGSGSLRLWRSVLDWRSSSSGSCARPSRTIGMSLPPRCRTTLWDLTQGGGFSLSEWLLEHGNRLHAEEFAIHRSGYQLKEADPHTWGIPRLNGRAKAAMVMIQSDEYGGGEATEMHSSLFADSMSALGLDPTYSTYLDRLPAVTLATTNLISMFGLHRRLRGALVGHLASFEMNSVGQMARYHRVARIARRPARRSALL